MLWHDRSTLYIPVCDKSESSMEEFVLGKKNKGYLRSLTNKRHMDVVDASTKMTILGC